MTLPYLNRPPTPARGGAATASQRIETELTAVEPADKPATGAAADHLAPCD